MLDLEDRLLTASEAVHFLGLMPSTIRRMTQRGEIPFVKPTGRRAVRYRLSDLEALLRVRTTQRRER